MKVLRLIYQKKGYPNPYSINVLIWVPFILLLFSACNASKPYVAKNPASQRFRDVTRLLFQEKLFVFQARFLRANQDAFSDLAVLDKTKTKLYILINRRNKGFLKNFSGQWTQENKEKINFFVSTDLNGDGGDDLVLILGGRKKPKTRTLFNNKKGYFYPKENEGTHFLAPGIEKVVPIDIDGDGDKDLFYFGSKTKASNKKSHQTMILVNKGDGSLENLTSLLMPDLPDGIQDASFADYDGDGVVDIFLVYKKKQNRLLLNNGVGKFSDYTSSRLPKIIDDSMHADWADFDQDGDNDLLIVNRSIEKKYRGYFRETNYFLENIGGGNFRKRSHKILPRLPAQKVYLLDGNGNTRPDALILTVKGVFYFQARRSKWQFSDETEKRLPGYRQFSQMVFGNINRDKFLDLFAWSEKTKRLWINRFD